MAYLGQTSLPFDPTRTVAAPRDADRFSGNASTVTFTLSRFVQKAVDIEVFVENVQQEPLTAYDVNGTSLTFTGAPPSGTNNVYVVYRNFDSGAQSYVPDGSITYNKLANNIRIFTTDNLTPNGNNSVFTLSEPPADANTVMVTVDGIIQRAPVHYTTSGSTITFSSAPAAGSNVHVRHLGFRTTATVTQLAANSTISQPTLQSPIISGNAVLSNGVTFTGASYFNTGPTINGLSSANFGLTVSQTDTANTLSLGFDNTPARGQITMNNLGSSFRIGVQATEAWSITKEGYNLRPYQPFFFTGQAPGQTITTTPTKFAYTNVVSSGNYISGLNTTSASTYYSDANDRFTAPIGGVYLLGARTNILATGVSVAMAFYKNGSQMQGATMHSAENFNRRDFHLVAPFYLSAGDYVEVYVWTSSSTVVADNSGFFYGYLLG